MGKRHPYFGHYVFFKFLLYVGIQPIKSVVIVSSGQQRDSVIHIHVTLLL